MAKYFKNTSKCKSEIESLYSGAPSLDYIKDVFKRKIFPALDKDRNNLNFLEKLALKRTEFSGLIGSKNSDALVDWLSNKENFKTLKAVVTSDFIKRLDRDDCNVLESFCTLSANLVCLRF